MTSYTSSILLTMLLGCAMAADSDRTLRRKLSVPPPGIDTPLAGSFVSLSQLKHSSNSDSEYGNSLEYANEYANTIRNSYGTKGGKGAAPYDTKGTKAPKVPGINPYPSKDCPKKRKDGSKYGAKGGGKYSKKSAAPSISSAPSISAAPSTNPTVSNQPSESIEPSVAPSESFKPSGFWCQDTEAPSISPAPTVSSAPSGSPTVSAKPTVSNAPSVSPAPSSNPTVSQQPSESSAPSATPSVSQAPSSAPSKFKSRKGDDSPSDGGARTDGETQSSCNVYTATFEGNTAVLCNPAETQCGDGDATAVVTSDIESLDLSGTTGYNVDVTIEVEGGPSADTIEDGLDKTLTQPVTLALVGCAGKARNVALEHYRSNSSARRRLQDGTAALMNKWSCGKLIHSRRGLLQLICVVNLQLTFELFIGSLCLSFHRCSSQKRRRSYLQH